MEVIRKLFNIIIQHSLQNLNTLYNRNSR